MCISTEAYRAAIGLFNNCSRDCVKMYKFPNIYFFHNLNHNFYGLRSWSRHLRANSMNKLSIRSNVLLRQMMAISIIIQSILVLSNDVELNPGPILDNVLSICHTNLRSLKAKDRLMHVKCEFIKTYDIITASETWLKPSDKSDNFTLSGYQMPFRRDRQMGLEGYGGVLAWVSNSIACKHRRDLESNDLEALWLEIRLKNRKFLMCVLYRPPNNEAEFWDILSEKLVAVKQVHNMKLLLIGDLNAHFSTRNGDKLESLALTHNLTIHNFIPTRITQNSATVLDQCLSNFPSDIKSTQVLAPVSSNDHSTLAVTIKFAKHKTACYQRVMWDYKLANFDGFRNAVLEYDWDQLFNVADVNVICDSWSAKLIELAKQFIPNKLVFVRPNDKPWYNGYLRRLNRKKQRLYKLAKQSNTLQKWANFTRIRNFYHSEIKRHKTAFELDRYKKLATDKFLNPKTWWTILKEVYKNCDIEDGIPPIEIQNHILTDDAAKAEAFNKHFIAASKVDDSHTDLPFDPQIRDDNFDLNLIHVTVSDVEDQIKLLDVNKAFGPDGISPKIIKECIGPISIILARLFNYSLYVKQVPSLWKKANVLPLHKKGLKSDISNYRPISILSCVSKMFERIVFKYIYNHLRANFVLSNFQSGFLPGRSTTTQLLEVFNCFSKAIDSNKEVRVVFLDISKAFDKVWHKGLLHKMKKCGIGGELLEWFKDYLHDRYQRVLINGQSSPWECLTAGVPQGSVLGPLLFLLYINDMTLAVRNSSVRLFADDTCLFIEVDNRFESAALINEDLSSISAWANQWLITFSPSKTKSLILSKKNDYKDNPTLFLNNHPIEEVISHTYLGVTFSNNLRWSKHIDAITSKARKRLNMMLPLKFKVDRASLETMYNSFVLPVLEYANVVWGGVYDCDKVKIEQIHIDAMRLIVGATAKSNILKLYGESGWLPTQTRLENSKVTMIFKIKNHLAPNYLEELLPDEVQHQTMYNLRNNRSIRPPFSRLEGYKRSFFPSAISLWNNLSVQSQSCLTIQEFKNLLNTGKPEKPILYYYGERWACIHHARLRIGCSMLKSDLCFNLHVTDDPSCACGFQTENALHFFLNCNRYLEIRRGLITAITSITACSLTHILYGDPEISYLDNKAVFEAVHTYLRDSKRFV